MKGVLVDTSVWIDFLNNRSTESVKKLELLLEMEESIYICGLIQMEILQGIRSDLEFQKTKKALSHLLWVELENSHYLEAAKVYRKLKARGLSIRKSIDGLIAVMAIKNNLYLLYSDRDFTAISKYTSLKLLS